MNETIEYTQFTEPDKKALADALAECKGSDRTMAQFAEACGISPSTLSRILNRNITKPLSEDMLKSIYEHRVDECKVEMDELYRANGMMPREERERFARLMEYRRRLEEMQNVAQQTIINEVFNRGYAVKADIPHSMAGRSKIMDTRADVERGDLSIRYSLGLILPELHNLSEWVFQIYSGSAQDTSHMPNRSVEFNAKATIRRMMQTRSDIFLVDAWQPERLTGIKYSWVFTDPYLYDAFREYTKTARLNNAMSTILVDPNERVILKEEWMNCPMKNDCVSLFKDENDRRPGTDYEYRPRRMIENDEEDSE